MKTAIQQTIEWVDEISNSVFALSSTENELKMLTQFREKLVSMLPTEKMQIIDARATLYSELFGIHLNAPRNFAEKYYDKVFANN